MHFCLTHALLRGHSGFVTHSGRQCGGLPMYSGEHEQIAFWFTDLHILYGPHGEGLQGSDVVSEI